MNTAAYPIVRYESVTQFRDIAKELDALVKFFNLNAIAPFMYDPELQNFIADYRRNKCKKLPFLRFAMDSIFDRYSMQNSPDVNRPMGREYEDGEWVDIDDDSDDEITFPNRDIQVHTENDTLDDTVPLGESTSQQDEYQDNSDQDVLPTTDAEQDIERLNETMYFSVDEQEYDDYDTDRVAQNMTYKHYYRPNQYAPMTDNGLYSSGSVD